MTGGVIFGQANDDDDGNSPLSDLGAVNLIELIGDADDTDADGNGKNDAAFTDDLNLGSVDIIGIGDGVADGESRTDAGIVFNGGTDNSREAGTVDPGLDNGDDDTLVINTFSADVRFNGSVRLDSDVTIDTDQDADTLVGGADVLFTNDAFIDSQLNLAGTASEGNDLVLDVGIASVFFNENIGALDKGELGQLVVQEADGFQDAAYHGSADGADGRGDLRPGQR